MSSDKHLLYRMAYRMAMADGELSANEALVLHLFQDDLGLSSSEARALRDADLDVPWESLSETFAERASQLELFETACLMAMVDGRADPEEWNLVIRLCEIFDIERDLAQQHLARARERLNDLARDHNLLPEIQRNMEEQAREEQEQEQEDE
jgi:hypothetical protein